MVTGPYRHSHGQEEGLPPAQSRGRASHPDGTLSDGHAALGVGVAANPLRPQKGEMDAGGAPAHDNGSNERRGKGAGLSNRAL